MNIFKKNCFPDFLVIGSQKGGTSSLHSYLNQHPNLKGSVPKELHFFDNKIYQGKDLNWYKSHFKKPIFSSIKFFETTPSYIYHEKIAKMIYSLKPDIKLIVCIRNPVDRAFSAWNMYRQIFEQGKSNIFNDLNFRHNIYEILYKDREVFPSFEECIEIELSLMGTEELEPAILRKGLYYKQIKNYLKYFSNNNIYIIDSSKLLEDTLGELNKVCTFLNINEFKKQDFNPSKQHVRDYNIKMNDETRKKLMEFYSVSNENLFKLLGYKLKW